MFADQTALCSCSFHHACFYILQILYCSLIMIFTISSLLLQFYCTGVDIIQMVFKKTFLISAAQKGCFVWKFKSPVKNRDDQPHDAQLVFSGGFEIVTRKQPIDSDGNPHGHVLVSFSVGFLASFYTIYRYKLSRQLL